MINAGSILGNRYRVLRRIGGGGMKEVYLAEDLRLANRRCALAEMIDSASDAATRQQAIASFNREASILATLEHEHIVRIYDRFSDQNRHYLVMEYVVGETLERKLQAAGGMLEEAAVVDVAIQALGALEYLHGLKPPIVYRDLKPSNVMITAEGRVKLVDFGIARHFQPQITATMIGTHGYAPPEQYSGKVEARSDLYALGAMMHHLVTGRDPSTVAPFSFPPVAQLNPACSQALAILIDQALAYSLDRRVPSAAEFKRRLMLITAADPSRPGPFAPTIPRLKEVAARPEKTTIPCRHCTRQVPGDARTCPYCSRDLANPAGGGTSYWKSSKQLLLVPRR